MEPTKITTQKLFHLLNDLFTDSIRTFLFSNFQTTKMTLDNRYGKEK
jgi:hypothetical protein